ncbi:MAG: biosis protein MshN [Panacagrimonas sp.]|jgi:tetratricopeptide (TPR) repeat protein|nr:hypothetical protein [Panacagrimonas sp.]MCC2656161.1 biosis protein MshN [Panacagrimonas sp.]
MSLINRMLDDLAARQAPGAESLQGVRLNEPLQAANADLDRSKLALLLLVMLAIAAGLWWWWPGGAQVAPPQARPAPVLASTPPTPAPVEAETESPAEAIAPQLQLTSRLTSLEAAPVATIDAPAVLDDAERVEREQTRAQPPQPRALPEPASPKAVPVPAPEPAARPIATPAAQPVPIDPAVERRHRARQALTDQDPATALLIVTATDAERDVESAALRAAALQRLGRHAEAAEAYAALTTRDPIEPAHWVGLAISLEREQRPEPARIAYRRALQSDRLAPSLRAFAQDRVTALETP